jgi:hypothetical protein
MVVAALSTVQKDLSIKWKGRAYSIHSAKEQSFNHPQAETREGKGSYTLQDRKLLQGESLSSPPSIHHIQKGLGTFQCSAFLPVTRLPFSSPSFCHSLFLVSFGRISVHLINSSILLYNNTSLSLSLSGAIDSRL